MAPIAEDQMTLDTMGEDRKSPIRQQFTESFYHRSESSSPAGSPSPVIRKSKCPWCGKLFQSFLDGDETSHTEALKGHISQVHSHTASKRTTYDRVDEDLVDEEGDGENEEGEFDEEDVGVSAAADLAENEDSRSGTAETDHGVVTTETRNVGSDNLDDEDDNQPSFEEQIVDRALADQDHEHIHDKYMISIKSRLDRLWNIHDVNLFCPSYEELVTEAEQSWSHAFRGKERGKKRDSREILDRPEPYKKRKAAAGECLEITPLEDFLSQLRNPESRTYEELYALALNASHALRAWQDESYAIEKLIKNATRHAMRLVPNPRQLEDSCVFEDRKEAMLYGYRHDPKSDKISNQDPFVQGGFKPTAAQLRKMTAKAGPNNPNPDGWPSTVIFGVEHVPKFQDPPHVDVTGKLTRNKRKVAQVEAASRANETDGATTETAAAAVENDNEASERLPRNRIRNQNAQRSITHILETTQNRTASPRPAPTRASTARGRPSRVRNRGARTTPSGPSRRGKGSGSAQPGFFTGLVPLQAAPRSSASIKPAPIAPASTTQTAASTPTGTSEDLDAAEVARQEKIAKSKNPKRTEAMIRHWQRFNSEGRTRNPKRTKAQILADQTKGANDKATQPSTSSGSKGQSGGGSAGDSCSSALAATATSHGDASAGGTTVAFTTDRPAPYLGPPLQPSVFRPQPIFVPYTYPGLPGPPSQMVPQSQGYHHSPYADPSLRFPAGPMPRPGRPHGPS